MLFVLGACVFATAAWLVFQPPYSYRFDHPLMTGLTKQKVVDRVGKPTSIPEAGGGDIWIYQIGMDPDAIITFDSGIVAEVWTAHQKNAFQ